MIGGLWGASPTEWVAPVAQNEDWFLLAAKFMWRQGLVRCPEKCSTDARRIPTSFEIRFDRERSGTNR